MNYIYILFKILWNSILKCLNIPSEKEKNNNFSSLKKNEDYVIVDIHNEENTNLL